MDLSQKKLSKSEWASVEVSVSDSEKQVLELITEGFDNPNICKNATITLALLMKIEINPGLEHYLFKEYFDEIVSKLCSSKNAKLCEWYKSIRTTKHASPNKADMIRISNVRSMISSQRNIVFEYILLDFCAGALGKATQPDGIKTSRKSPWHYVYSLKQFQQLSVLAKVNKYVRDFVDLVVTETLNAADQNAVICDIFQNASEYIEKNPYLIQFEDKTLYAHQKTLFKSIEQNPHLSKLILYMAPTGTGKTLSPIGLSQKYRVIFVCVARHVGLALAKSAISVGKRVAFAFGCETASDIRLHYFAAQEYKINKRSGGIGKVDNSIGTKVEIMICDVASYVTAMHYMIAFNDTSRIVTFWDEPTITMDKPDDPLHALIHRNWCENRIPKMVLSCATLPKLTEITQTINDFKLRFTVTDEDTGEEYEPEILTIDSYECKKSITLLNKDSKCVLPHLLFANYRDVLRCVEHCEANKTLLRYFDVNEIVRFVTYLRSTWQLTVSPETYFKSVQDITMNTLKQYYLRVLGDIDGERWEQIHTEMRISLTSYFSAKTNTIRKFHSVDSAHRASSQSASSNAPIRRTTSVSSSEPVKNGSEGILLTTRDAHTLTDGPTIFLAEDVDKIGRFYIQQSNIPENVISALLLKIENNNAIQARIAELEQVMADKTGESNTSKPEKENTRKSKRETVDPETQRFLTQIANMREKISMVSLNPIYVPNTTPHQNVWLPADTPPIANAFTPTIGEEDVREIMSTSVDNQRKLLLILGIGVFSQSIDPQYAEVMKRMAYAQQLFLIIASSDYIYGTNYQFCHGFIGKDLFNMTQQKTIQAIGRIGRNNIQNEYTVRFRDDAVLEQLFRKIDVNIEAVVMSRLFCSAEEDDDKSV
jgi:hypothetical protein